MFEKFLYKNNDAEWCGAKFGPDLIYCSVKLVLQSKLLNYQATFSICLSCLTALPIDTLISICFNILYFVNLVFHILVLFCIGDD